MDALYLVPMEQIGTHRGPKYFAWMLGGSVGTGTITARWSLMDYGFLPTALIWTIGLSAADAAFLAAQADVYAWPATLDQPVADSSLSTFFESLRIPTDWLTPSSTYRQLLRTMAGLFQFMQRYAGVSRGHTLFESGVTLETNYNQLSAQAKSWLDATIASFGYPSVQGNPKLRALAKQAGDLWGSQPFLLGSLTF